MYLKEKPPLVKAVSYRRSRIVRNKYMLSGFAPGFTAQRKIKHGSKFESNFRQLLWAEVVPDTPFVGAGRNIAKSQL